MPIESGMLTRSLEGPEEGGDLLRHPQAGVRVRRGDEQPAACGVFRTSPGAGWPCPQEAGDRLRRTHHGRNRGGLCESGSAAGGWDLGQLVGKVKEFIYLLEDLTPDQVQGLGMEELKTFLQEQLRNAYDLKEGQRTATPGADARGRAFLHPSTDRHPLARTSPGDGCTSRISRPARLRPEGSSD